MSTHPTPLGAQVPPSVAGLDAARPARNLTIALAHAACAQLEMYKHA